MYAVLYVHLKFFVPSYKYLWNHSDSEHSANGVLAAYSIAAPRSLVLSSPAVPPSARGRRTLCTLSEQIALSSPAPSRRCTSRSRRGSQRAPSTLPPHCLVLRLLHRAQREQHHNTSILNLSARGYKIGFRSKSISLS